MKRTFISILIFYTINFLFAQEESASENCFKCHGMATLAKKVSETGITQNLAVIPEEFSNSFHAGQACFDCHSEEFASFPHSGDAKAEELNCTDCHEGVSETTGADFDKINEAFEASVHYIKSDGEFKCTDCHNAHKPFIGKENPKYTAKTNEVCFTCHISESGQPGLSLKEKHISLSESELDWEVQSCLDCHTEGTAEAFKHKIVSKKGTK